MTVMPRVPQFLQNQDVAFSFWCGQVADDALAVTGFAVEEAIFGLTRSEIMLVSEDSAIDLNALIDTPATLTVHHKYLETPRHFSGVIVEAERGDAGHHRTAYRMTLLPVLHRLDLKSDCRAFQGQTVPEIVGTILAEHGIEHVEWQIGSEHLAREFCVQYRETHLAFIERILAEEGIFYFFRHDGKGRHTLVLTDEPGVLADCPGQAELSHNALASGAVKGVWCSSFSFREKLAATSFIQRDYTFHAPAANMEHRYRPPFLNGAKGDYAFYDYPGRYKEEKTGEAFTRNKLEAARVDASLAHGHANAPHLIAGHGVTLTDHPQEGLNRRWRLLTIRHEGRQPQAFAEDGIGGLRAKAAPDAPSPAASDPAGALFGLIGSANPGSLTPSLGRQPVLAATASGEADAGHAATYACAFTAQSSLLPYRPPQRQKPLVDGPQIAKVVGPPGEEIYTDEHARVKVQFPWDRHARGDDTSSCWIRVAQNWAGATWGHIAIPRIGHEVVVDFLEGDPDQPIITGRTYHATNKTPYKLPDHKTKMVIRSDTHKGNGFNEISFEDQAGEENMFLHAQKDQTIKVLNNRAKRVNANQVESIGQNKSIDVGGNHQEKIGGSMNLSVGGGGMGLLGALGAIAAAGGRDSEVGSAAIGDTALGEFAGGMAAAGIAAESLALGGNAAFAGAGNHFREAGREQVSSGGILGGLLSKMMPLSGVLMTVVEKFRSDTIGIARTEQIGAYKNTSVGHTMTINVGEEFIVKVGQSRFVMDKDGNVTITGVKFNFTASGPVHINGKVVDMN